MKFIETLACFISRWKQQENKAFHVSLLNLTGREDESEEKKVTSLQDTLVSKKKCLRREKRKKNKKEHRKERVTSHLLNVTTS